MARKRETAQIFDLILKRLIRLSSVAVIHFINGLFGADHPLDSTVEYPNTESVSKKLRRLMSDTIIIIGGVHVYNIEAEIGDDESIVLRVFEYGFAEGLRTKTLSDDGRKISVKFPKARIIYWETTRKTPDEVTLSLEFPESGSYEYKVKTFKFLEHGIDELEKKKLAILLPFYVLQLRKKVAYSKSSEDRAKLAGEMKAILDNLIAAIDRAARTGLMNEADKREALEYTERLYKELFAHIDEFREADVVLQDRILTYSEEAAAKAAKAAKLEGIAELAGKLLAKGVSPDIIAESSGMPIDKIKALAN